MRRFLSGPLLACAAAAFAFPPAASAQVRGVCVYNCDSGPAPVYTPQPSGPSPQELRRQREEKDLREATDDAHEKAVEAHDRGDLDAAARYLREALEYTPGDPTLLQELLAVETKIREARAIQFGRAAEDLRSAEHHSQAAAAKPGAESMSDEAQGRFDRGGAGAGTIVAPRSGASIADPVRDPVVPPGRRTPAIARLEGERQQARQQAAAVEQRLATLNPATQSVEIAKAKQEKSTIESKIQYLNFSITKQLDAPDAK